MSTGAAGVPYPGLRAFSRDESHLFFGRESSTAALIDKLAETRFLAVLGASGSGKSSLVYTGLLDALEIGLHPAGSDWLVAAMRPGGAPMRNLAAALLKLRGDEPEASDVDVLAAALRRGPRAILEWQAAGNLRPGENLLLLVDQFEELFRYGDYAGREEAEGFARLLVETSVSRDGEGNPLPISVCLTMRSEYLGACAMIPGVAERINDGLFLTPRMTRDECRAAIEKPAAVSKFAIEPLLVNQLLNDMAELAPWEADSESDQLQRLAQRADQLPLMQHLLNTLWLRAKARTRKGKPLELTHADYKELGGLRGALDSHGAEVLAELERKGGDRQVEGAAERVFRALVTGNSLATAVRRPCRFSELVANAGDRDLAERVVEAFRAPTCNFLQPPASVPLAENTVVDISHESLIRQWQRLAAWFELEAESAATWRRLQAEQEACVAGKGDLLTGLTLANRKEWWEREQPTEAWAARHGDKFDEVDRYLRESVETETVRTAEAAAAAQAMRDRRMMRYSLSVVSVLALLAVGGAVYGFSQQSIAKEEALRAEAARATALDQKELAVSARTQAETASRLADKAREEAESARDDTEKALAEAKESQRRLQLAEQSARIARDEAVAGRSQAEQAAELERRVKEEQQRMFEALGEIIGSNEISQDMNPERFRQEVLKNPSLASMLAAYPHRSGATGKRKSTTAAGVFNDVAEALRRFAEASSIDGRSALGPGERLQTYYWLGLAQERKGAAGEALKSYIQAFEIGRAESERLRGWQNLPRPVLLATLAAGYDVAWWGERMGEPDADKRATEFLRSVGREFKPEALTGDPELAARLAEISNLESIILEERGAFPEEMQPLRAQTLDYAAIPLKDDIAPVRDLYRYHVYQSNFASVHSGDAKSRLIEAACDTAKQVAERGWHPDQGVLYGPATIGVSRCANMLLEAGDPRGLNMARSAIAMFGEALEADSRDQEQRLYRGALATLAAQSVYLDVGCNIECLRWLKVSRDDLLVTLRGRSLFTVDSEASSYAERSRPKEDGEVSRPVEQARDQSALATNGDLVSQLLTTLTEEWTFDPSGTGDGTTDPIDRRPQLIREFILAMAQSRDDFPEASGVNLAWANLNRTLAELPEIEVDERERGYAEAAKALQVYAFRDDPRDDVLVSQLCNIELNRVRMHKAYEFVARSRLELAKEIAADCQAYARRNPWHAYVQGSLVFALEDLVPDLDEPLDPNLAPYLEFASLWGSTAATEYLLGQAQDESSRKLLQDRLDVEGAFRFDYDLTVDVAGSRQQWLWTYQRPPGEPLLATRLSEYHANRGEQLTPDGAEFITRVELLARELGTSFPRLASELDNAGSDHPLRQGGESEYAAALRLLEFKTGRTPVDAKGIAFGGYDPTTLSGKPQKGQTRFAKFTRDAIVLFASKEAMDGFSDWQLAIFNGYDPVALAEGRLVAGDPLIVSGEEGVLFLFVSEANRTAWESDPEALLKKAAQNWRQLLPAFEGDASWLFDPQTDTDDLKSRAGVP